MIDAAVLEPITLAVRTLEHVQPRLGDSRGHHRTGSIGLFHLQAFQIGWRSIIIVIGLDQDARRLEIAKRLGADHRQSMGVRKMW